MTTTFMVTTKVTFTNVYFIDAEDFEEAEDMAANDDLEPVLQRFDGEVVTSSEEGFDPAYVIIDLKAEGFH
jgi:hypothetical protein